MSETAPFAIQEMNADEAIATLANTELTREEVVALRHAESAGRSRKTVLEALDAILAVESDPDEPTHGTPDDFGLEDEAWPGGLEPGTRVFVEINGQLHEASVVDHRGGVDVRLRDGRDTILFVPTETVKRELHPEPKEG